VRRPLERLKKATEMQKVQGEIGFRLQVVQLPGSETLVHSNTISAVLSTVANKYHTADGLARIEDLAAKLLGNLTDTDAKVDRLFEATPPVLKVVRDAQKRFMDCEKAMSSVGKLVLTLLRNPKHRGKIDEMALNTTLKLFNECPQYTQHTMHAMQIVKLIRGTDGLYSFTLDNIGIPAVSRILDVHSDKPEVLLEACDTLPCLIETSEDVESFSRSKGVKRCIDVMHATLSGTSESERSSELRCKCVDVLLCIAAVPEGVGVKELLILDAVNLIVEVLKAGGTIDLDFCKKSAELLELMCKGEPGASNSIEASELKTCIAACTAEVQQAFAGL